MLATDEVVAQRFPFSAVVGQDSLKQALILCAIAPEIGGVLIRGEKGTAKSTIVRALAPLLPPTVTGQAGRVVELPIGATEDRVIGSIDVHKVLRDGDASFTPGLLAAADGGVLYIDEVNLLADHLVDVLLDAAAMGRVTVERDSTSRSYSARFVLVGTMNPEEGELRPQLLDRFGLAVSVRAPRAVDERVEVITRRMAYDADPASFSQAWRAADVDVAQTISDARSRLSTVVLSVAEMRRIAAVCAHLEVDGLRGDIVVARAARAHAAWRGAEEVTEADVRVAVELALPHRRRRDAFDESETSADDLDDAMQAGRAAADGPEPDPDPGGGPGTVSSQGSETAEGEQASTGASDPCPPTTGPSGPDSSAPDSSAGAPGPESCSGAPSAESSTGESGADRSASTEPMPAPPTRAVPIPGRVVRALRVSGIGDGDPGRRSPARSRRGSVVGASPQVLAAGIHLHATVLAAIERQADSRGRGLTVEPDDLRGAIRVGREGNLVVFAVDLSGSMTARQRLDAVSGACSALLRDSYQRRDRVAVVVLKGTGAHLVVPPTRSVTAALRGLTGIATGGRTPLAEGIIEAAAVIQRARHTDPRRRSLMVVITDGRATSGPGAVPRAMAAADRIRRLGVHSVVVDCEQGVVRLGLAARLAGHLGARHLDVGDVTTDAVVGAVRRSVA
ncbi:VWA domain-containing protein [Williamsia sp. CHRR-6]|nr:VWA domain-containing protein [Williamsia sp. CHRR-6]